MSTQTAHTSAGRERPTTRATASRTPTTGGVLRLQNVVKDYPGPVHALRQVSIEIDRGEQAAVLGPSGSGKTTMLTIMGTLERPSSGHPTARLTAGSRPKPTDPRRDRDFRCCRPAVLLDA